MAVPTSANATIIINEDTPRALSPTDIPFTDGTTGHVLTKLQITTLPTVGTLTFNGVAVTLNQEIIVVPASGTLLYTPALNASGAAYATIGFKVSDGTDYSVAAYVLTIDVTAVNDAPVGSHFSFSTVEDTVYNGTLPVATDVEGGTLTYAKVVSPSHGTATVNAGGTFTYTPTTNYIGTDSFTYSVTDTSAGVNVYTVSVIVTAVRASIPFSAVTTITDVGDDLTGAKEAIDAGTGAFDGLMVAINAHLSLQYHEGRIKGPDYATVYLGAMQVAITQAVTFVLQKPIAEKQADSETSKRLLIERQTKGFDDDAKQKLMKQMLDSWSVAYSVAKDANSIPDSIKVNPIDSVTKNAMDALGIVTSNNPIGEI